MFKCALFALCLLTAPLLAGPVLDEENPPVKEDKPLDVVTVIKQEAQRRQALNAAVHADWINRNPFGWDALLKQQDSDRHALSGKKVTGVAEVASIQLGQKQVAVVLRIPHSPDALAVYTLVAYAVDPDDSILPTLRPGQRIAVSGVMDNNAVWGMRSCIFIKPKGRK